MRIIEFKEYKIEILDEPTYKHNSTDNNFNYTNIYFGENAEDYPTSKHGIKIYENEILISNCIIIGSGGATTIHDNSFIIDGENLIICCSDSVFSIQLIDLKLNWFNKFDTATCFQIFQIQKEYIIHGELEITMIDKNGNMKWNFGGEDIFVSIDNVKEFKITENAILLTDFANTHYKLDFNGNLIK